MGFAVRQRVNSLWFSMKRLRRHQSMADTHQPVQSMAPFIKAAVEMMDESPSCCVIRAAAR